MSWLSVTVRAPVAREAVVQALFDGGCAGVQEIGVDLVTILPGDADAAAIVRRVRAADVGAHVETALVPEVDWTEQWKRGITAHRVGRLVVAPPWLAAEHDPATTIVIEPAMAFGTGEHATTRGVLRLLGDAVRPGARVADLGAGSAVLSIAAAKLGAARVAAIELDPDAIGNAEDNVKANGVSHVVTVLEGDAALLLPLVAPVDLVLANIISSVLVELLPAIGEALVADGHAILSGILREERDDLVQVLTDSGWRVLAEDHEEIWWSAAIARR